jgi:competence CoiA-like predicted nuclease
MTTITAFDNDRNIIGIEVAKKGIDYTCRDCGTKLIPVLNCTCVRHFRHQNAKECDFIRKEMSEWHMNWQLKFKPEFREVCFRDDNNKIINRADFFNGNYVIEFQHSRINDENIIKRENTYRQNAESNLIWVLDGSTNEQETMMRKIIDRIHFSKGVFLDTGKDLKMKYKDGYLNFSYNDFYINFNLESSLINPLINRGEIIMEKVIQVNNSLKQEMREKTRKEVIKELREEITEELREEIRKDVKEKEKEKLIVDVGQIREEIRNEVRNMVRRTLSYEIKDEIKDELRERFLKEIKETYRPCLSCGNYLINSTEPKFKTLCLVCYKTQNGFNKKLCKKN